MKQTSTTKLYSDGEDRTLLQSIGLAKFCTSWSSSAHQIKGKITENAGNLVHELNTASLSKASKRWQEKQMERIEDGKLN
jgi:hypothetical protein